MDRRIVVRKPMPRSDRQTFHAHCSCGRVEFEGTGEPLATLACYCDDCQSAAKQIDALSPAGHSGLRADGGSVSVCFRKDRVHCVRGSELLVPHKLRPRSPTTRLLASCCNSNMSTQFDNWFPMAALRTHSVNVDSVRPEICINTRFAPDPHKISYDVPRSARVPGGFLLKLLAATAQLALQRLPLGDGRVT
jgi:hypothetical protein